MSEETVANVEDPFIPDIELGYMNSMKKAESSAPSFKADGGLVKEECDATPIVAEEVAWEFPHVIKKRLVTRRLLYICFIAMWVGVLGCLAALALLRLIFLITNICFYGHFSAEKRFPNGNHLGGFVVFIPVAGSLLIGFMARYGSKAIRGHGIPEAMEQILRNESRIHPRVTILKPLSAAISIGTGGPFGAEGPIIATGAGFGSNVGQILSVSSDERKALLAAGAAAGMTATFGTPLSAILLAVELLLFEYRFQSLLPVALSCFVSAAGRMLAEGYAPVFSMHAGTHATVPALIVYLILGGLVGGMSVGVIRSIYFVEDSFDRLPIHWMWWPAMGGLVVGVIAIFEPRILGVGYETIDQLLKGSYGVRETFRLGGLKFLAWSVALGSGTSGGTLAPMLIIGGSAGSLLAKLAQLIVPFADVDPQIGALVGMASNFAGCSRAPMASILFLFEATHEVRGLLPLIGGVMASFIVSSLFKRNSIMTEKIDRRGVLVPNSYSSNVLEVNHVSDVCSMQHPVVMKESDSLADVREWLTSGVWGSEHQGYPVLSDEGQLKGVITRKDIYRECHQGCEGEAAVMTVKQLIRRPPVIVFDQSTVKDVMNQMLKHGVGRVAVVKRGDHNALVGILVRHDILHTLSHTLSVEKEDEDEDVTGPEKNPAASYPAPVVTHGGEVELTSGNNTSGSYHLTLNDDVTSATVLRKRSSSLLIYVASHSKTDVGSDSTATESQANQLLSLVEKYYRVQCMTSENKLGSARLVADTVTKLLSRNASAVDDDNHSKNRARIVVKIGSHTGYSAVAIAAALNSSRGDMLFVIEQSGKSLASTESLLKLSGLRERVTLCKSEGGKVGEWSERLTQSKSIDVLVLSHHKACYCDDLKVIEEAALLHKGSAVVATNVLGVGYPLGEYMKHVRNLTHYSSSETLGSNEDKPTVGVSLEVSIRN